MSNIMTEEQPVCVCGTFSVEHSIEEVLGLSLQPADPRLLLFEVFALRQHLAASTVLHAVLLKRHEKWVKTRPVHKQKPSHAHTITPTRVIASSCDHPYKLFWSADIRNRLAHMIIVID